jgi:hypothetical protein
VFDQRSELYRLSEFDSNRHGVWTRKNEMKFVEHGWEGKVVSPAQHRAADTPILEDEKLGSTDYIIADFTHLFRFDMISVLWWRSTSA